MSSEPAPDLAPEALAFIGTSVTPHFAYGLRAFTPEVLARRLLLGALHEERWQPGTLR